MAKTPASSCTCACGGAFHSGGGSGRGSGTAREGFREVVDKTTAFFRKPLVRSLLARALIFGLTAINPVLGSAVNSAYTDSSYINAGIGLWKTYQEWASKKEEAYKVSRTNTAEDIAGYATAPYAEEGANRLTEEADKSGLLNDLSERTKIAKPILREMLKGTSEQAISDKFSEFAGFIVSKL